MDINILLVLQDFRNGAGAFLAGFLSKMTWLGELNTAIVIMALIYWCLFQRVFTARESDMPPGARRKDCIRKSGYRKRSHRILRSGISISM